MATQKPTPDANTMVNFQIAVMRLREGKTARRLAWGEEARLEGTFIGDYATYSRVNLKRNGQPKNKQLLTLVDTQATDWMINQ